MGARCPGRRREGAAGANWPLDSSTRLAPADRIVKDYHAKRHVLAFQRSCHPAVTTEGVRCVPRDRKNLLLEERDRDVGGARLTVRRYVGSEVSCHFHQWVVGSAERGGEEIVLAALPGGSPDEYQQPGGEKEHEAVSLDEYLQMCAEDLEARGLGGVASQISSSLTEKQVLSPASRPAIQRQRAFLERVVVLDAELRVFSAECGLVIAGPVDLAMSSILLKLGDACTRVGDAAEARRHFEGSLLIQEAALGQDHVVVAATLRSLGEACGDLGDSKKKRKLLERALRIQEAALHEDHLEVALTLRSLGAAYGDLGEPKMQIELLERALRIQEPVLGPVHVEVARTLGLLGTAHGARGSTLRMNELLDRALCALEAALGPDNAEVARTLHDIGTAADLDTKRKRELLERALRIQEAAFGPDHVEVARTLRTLGSTYRDLSDAKKKKGLLERALRIQEAAFGPDHAEVARTLGHLGNAYGDLADAHGDRADRKMQRELLERALRLQEANFGSGHVEVAMIHFHMATYLIMKSDVLRATFMMENVIGVFQATYGANHHFTHRAASQLFKWQRSSFVKQAGGGD